MRQSEQAAFGRAMRLMRHWWSKDFYALQEIDPLGTIEACLFGPDGEPDSYRLWCLGMASPFAAMRGLRCDLAVDPRFDAGARREELARDWKIYSVSDTQSKISFFLEAAARDADEYLAGAMCQYPVAEWETQLSQELLGGAIEHRRLLRLCSNLAQNFSMFQFKLQRSFAAVDIASAAYVAQTAYGAGFFAAEEMYRYLALCGLAANQHYTEWSSYAQAVLFGKKLRQYRSCRRKSGDAAALDLDYDAVFVLGNSEQSYYRRLPFYYGVRKAEKDKIRTMSGRM